MIVHIQFRLLFLFSVLHFLILHLNLNVPKSFQTLRTERCNLSHRQTEPNLPSLHVDLHDFLMKHDGEKLRRFLLLDISGITHIDPAGAAALTEIQRNLYKNNLFVILCGGKSIS